MKKNGFGVKWPTKVDMPLSKEIKLNQAKLKHKIVYWFLVYKCLNSTICPHQGKASSLFFFHDELYEWYKEFISIVMV